MSCADDWLDAQRPDVQPELPLDEPDGDGFCGEYLSPTWWRKPWPVYKETARAVTLPDISLWGPAA